MWIAEKGKLLLAVQGALGASQEAETKLAAARRARFEIESFCGRLSKLTASTRTSLHATMRLGTCLQTKPRTSSEASITQCCKRPAWLQPASSSRPSPSPAVLDGPGPGCQPSQEGPWGSGLEVVNGHALAKGASDSRAHAILHRLLQTATPGSF